MIAALAASTGDLQQALDDAGALLGSAGRVVPAATEPVVLVAESANGEVRGQTAVQRTMGIRRVSLDPCGRRRPARGSEGHRRG